MELRYFKERHGPACRAADRVRMSGVETINKADDERGLRVGDHAAGLLVPLPRAGLSEITVPMQRALSMADADFRKEFAGRTVLIGERFKGGRRPAGDFFGRRRTGSLDERGAVQQILRNEMYAVPEVGVQWAAAAAWLRWARSARTGSQAGKSRCVVWFDARSTLW